jgi:ADP-heptose:LPS heptosyltransferase
MAAFDRIKRQNEQTYQARMLAILRSPEQFSRPLLKVPQPSIDRATERVSSVCRGTRRLAINVGSGGRWPKKMLDAEKIGKLINVVMGLVDVDIILVGGAAEQSKTGFLIEPCGSTRVHPMLTPDSIGDFVAVLMQADLLLSGDTLALHIATAINLPTIAVFGPTSAAEIPDFDGLIDKVWTPQLDCLGCYGDCAKVANCMSLLDIDYLAQRIVARLTQ